MSKVCRIAECGKPTVCRQLCHGHYARLRRYGRPEKETLKEKVMRNFTVNEAGCWIWSMGISFYGYGQIKWKREQKPAHRASWEVLRGPIPAGLQIDHLCRNRACINPDHLEPVTQRVNGLRGFGMGAQNARKTHCKQGHAFSGENVEIRKDNGGGRRCKICKRTASRKSKAKVRAKKYEQGTYDHQVRRQSDHVQH